MSFTCRKCQQKAKVYSTNPITVDCKHVYYACQCGHRFRVCAVFEESVALPCSDLPDVLLAAVKAMDATQRATLQNLLAT